LDRLGGEVSFTSDGPRTHTVAIESEDIRKGSFFLKVVGCGEGLG
jgi:hypothetical protein